MFIRVFISMFLMFSFYIKSFANSMLYPKTVFFTETKIDLMEKAMSYGSSNETLDFLLENENLKQSYTKKTKIVDNIKTAVKGDNMTVGIVYKIDDNNENWEIDVKGKDNESLEEIIDLKFNKDNIYIKINKNQQILDISEVRNRMYKKDS